MLDRQACDHSSTARHQTIAELTQRAPIQTEGMQSDQHRKLGAPSTPRGFNLVSLIGERLKGKLLSSAFKVIKRSCINISTIRIESQVE